MSNTVIKVENVSKIYRLGEVGTGTLAHDFNRWWHKVRGKEDPYLKIGQTNDRTVKATSDYSWALKDVSFEVKRGEVLGIIGRNGAGKSTLLKILSRVTTPTSGEIKIKGRIASLLEVGTGFNPELTGRENIYLNGAILGMRKREIDRKFDEIVDFAEVERYIDTPVKRYSSGMYVRLAFAVAAHLEPEILIVDEVLAVGDAEFQKKCLGKMQDVSQKEGRTVLFVSHNLGVISSLCQRVICLMKGSIMANGSPHDALSIYAEKTLVLTGSSDLTSPTILRRGDQRASFIEVALLAASNKNQITTVVEGEDFVLELKLVVREKIPIEIIDFTIVDPYNNDFFTGKLFDKIQPRLFEPGCYQFRAKFSPNFFARGNYNVRLACFGPHFYEYDHIQHAFTLLVAPAIEEKPGLSPRPGNIRFGLDWELLKSDEI